jgi:excinuclease ABC subunit A
MPSSAQLVGGAIVIRGARQNNLKGINLDLELNKFHVITGPSGSGKSSLAFDTIYAEGQRRYVETFSPYARQFLDRMDKPVVDEIRGIPPAIAIEQANRVRTTRSTVGTMTEINDYLKLLMPRIAKAFCPECAREIVLETPDGIATTVLANLKERSALVAFGIFFVPQSTRLLASMAEPGGAAHGRTVAGETTAGHRRRHSRSYLPEGIQPQAIGRSH